MSDKPTPDGTHSDRQTIGWLPSIPTQCVAAVAAILFAGGLFAAAPGSSNTLEKAQATTLLMANEPAKDPAEASRLEIAKRTHRTPVELHPMFAPYGAPARESEQSMPTIDAEPSAPALASEPDIIQESRLQDAPEPQPRVG